eukprot:m.199465 g.199465  ORF g.199465 m.199465 type:complete len:143 (-) comp13697_c2_seq2:630-1058(-)
MHSHQSHSAREQKMDRTAGARKRKDHLSKSKNGLDSRLLAFQNKDRKIIRHKHVDTPTPTQTPNSEGNAKGENNGEETNKDKEKSENAEAESTQDANKKGDDEEAELKDLLGENEHWFDALKRKEEEEKKWVTRGVCCSSCC